jgi:hypothetical protein
MLKRQLCKKLTDQEQRGNVKKDRKVKIWSAPKREQLYYVVAHKLGNTYNKSNTHSTFL